MNTPIEVDIYGHVNSTHIDGSRVVNGLGGSGDLFRHAYLSIVHHPSVRRLKDGRVVSCVLPYVRHIDHTEHDINCVVTEQGFALNTEIRSARHRAEDIISKCAHPHFQPILREYMKIAGGGDERGWPIWICCRLVEGLRRSLPVFPGIIRSSICG